MLYEQGLASVMMQALAYRCWFMLRYVAQIYRYHA